MTAYDQWLNTDTVGDENAGADREKELLREEQREAYEAERRARHEMLDELDMRIYTLYGLVDTSHNHLAYHELQKCSALIAQITKWVG